MITDILLYYIILYFILYYTILYYIILYIWLLLLLAWLLMVTSPCWLVCSLNVRPRRSQILRAVVSRAFSHNTLTNHESRIFRQHLSSDSNIFPPFLGGGLEHVLQYVSILYGNSHSNWLSYFSWWLKPPTRSQPYSKHFRMICQSIPQHFHRRKACASQSSCVSSLWGPGKHLSTVGFGDVTAIFLVGLCYFDGEHDDEL